MVNLFLLTSLALAAAETQFLKPRLEKSLVNTFPFNANEEDHGDHHDHHDHHEHHEHHDDGKTSSVGVHALLARQYPSGEVPPEEPGKKCVQKVMMVEETVWEDHETCDHSYDKRCHKSYTTTYNAVQEEECDEKFRKICYIEMVDVATNVTTEVCRRPLVKDCTTEGETICRTEYESECWNKQIPHEVEDDVVTCETVEEKKCEEETVGYQTKNVCQTWPKQKCSLTTQTVTKYTTMTGCHKEPTELCAPKGCGYKEGPEECHNVVKTVISEKPEEECIIEPQKQCKHVTKLVPQLQEVEECVDVPKEICTRSRTNPKKVKKPVIKNWCYEPSEEAGLPALK